MPKIFHTLQFATPATIENKTLKATDDRKKFRIWIWGNVAVLILILLAIPWPFYEGFVRPWVR